MEPLLYNGFLENISKKFLKYFSEISAVYNFDFGDEFEIALCKSLRSILPSYYGICRGGIFSFDGVYTGDDIVIYDQFHFPTLRLLEDNTFAQKQQIPFEAVFAYIEAKNTLVIEGESNNSISKALVQCQSIKELKRKDVRYSKYSINNIPFLNPLPNWPKIGNPLYTVIFSRGIRKTSNGQILDSTSGVQLLLNKISSLNQFEQPDMIIADYNSLLIPTINQQFESPFFMKDVSTLSANVTEELAYGIGLSNMFYAFDNIRLGKLYWPKIISNGMALPLVDEQE